MSLNTLSEICNKVALNDYYVQKHLFFAFTADACLSNAFHLGESTCICCCAIHFLLCLFFLCGPWIQITCALPTCPQRDKEGEREFTRLHLIQLYQWESGYQCIFIWFVDESHLRETSKWHHYYWIYCFSSHFCFRKLRGAWWYSAMNVAHKIGP